MCGFVGVYNYDGFAHSNPDLISEALRKLSLRGPDSNGTFSNDRLRLGHTRLSIIDTSTAASQPFSDPTGRFTLVFNGAIFNFRNLRAHLKQKGTTFRSESDTEVLLYWLIEKGHDGIQDLEGFFAFAFYDQQSDTLLLARDRFGEKPFYFHDHVNGLVFASELKALIELDIPKRIDMTSLSVYLHLNYIPGPWSIFENVLKLQPGHFMKVTPKGKTIEQYYRINPAGKSTSYKNDYQSASAILREKLTNAVEKRLIADVPLGTFLSGGIDSSIVTALAAKAKRGIETFSIGFKDEPMYDETRYARMVAKMYNTTHSEFMVSTNDLLDCVFNVLEYIDEPFADSSAIAVYILSRETRARVKVALSGDGADELFGGYYKHRAERFVRDSKHLSWLVKSLHPILESFPQSRNNPIQNKIRQFNRFANGMKLPAADRYWQWAGFASLSQVNDLLLEKSWHNSLKSRKAHWLKHISEPGHLGEVLQTDMELVLPYDMLVKTDMMSMSNSLEVRTPFLDHDLVNFVFDLPNHYKTDGKNGKKILRDTFRKDLPKALLQRPKKGFEVPLIKWFRNELNDHITEMLLNRDFINHQGIFEYESIKKLFNTMHSNNPGDSPSRIWGLLVLQQWWKKYFS
ncbi:MAG TPA: asparagine synthase (glutamine-hydrolyzing) [Bacteroidales bacterium]|nr:asparagine synthase (glutamine-hydrolyzing) [Bacteroidales bacterium]